MITMCCAAFTCSTIFEMRYYQVSTMYWYILIFFLLLTFPLFKWIVILFLLPVILIFLFLFGFMSLVLRRGSKDANYVKTKPSRRSQSTFIDNPDDIEDAEFKEKKDLQP